MLLAIDPGTDKSGFVVLNSAAPFPKVIMHGIKDNEEIKALIDALMTSGRTPSVVVEKIASYGRPVGESTFRTVWWTGRFAEFCDYRLVPFREMLRIDVKKALCHTTNKVTDAVLRQRLIDLYSDGKGKEVAIGRKDSPGPLYGVKSHTWQALALGVAHLTKG